MQHRWLRRSLPALEVALLLVLVLRQEARAQTFTKVTDASNPIVSDTGPNANSYFGSSWIDFDGDGDDDLFIDQTHLYRNNGGGSFTKLNGTGIGSAQVTNGTFNMEGNSWADCDNDGDLDAFLAGEHSSLYLQSAGAFQRVVGGEIGDSAATAGWACAWGDYDNDGAVDLAITHPGGFIPGPTLENHLFHNGGAPGYVLSRVSDSPIVTGIDAYTVGTWADYDDDGDLDFFIGSGTANGSLHPDNLFRNRLIESGSATFERITDAPIATDAQDGQVWNWIDYDNDGDLDGFLTNYGSPNGMQNRLYRQATNGTFANLADEITTDVDISLASVWQDFDNDGDLDCFVATDGARRDHYYRNNGNGSFAEDNASALRGAAVASRSATAADYDQDGDMDLFVLAPNANRALFRNDSANGNHWFQIRVVGTTANRSGLGAKVRVKAVIGGVPVWQRRDVSAQNQFNGQHSLQQHFGLGNATVMDSVVVEWPGGGVDVLRHVPADHRITLRQGGASDVSPTSGELRLRLDLRPNPSSGAVRFGIPSLESGLAQIRIYDPAGRLVRSLRETTSSGRVIEWDGRDAAGASVASGVYLCVAEQSGLRLEGRLILVR